MTIRKSCGTRMLFAMGILVALVMILTVSVSAGEATEPEWYNNTIVLQDGKIYIDSMESQVRGISWDEVNNKWIFNGLNICSDAPTIIEIFDSDTTIKLIGENHIYSTVLGGFVHPDYVDDGDKHIILSMNSVIMEGTGSLDISGGQEDWVYGIQAYDLTINSGNITCHTGWAGVGNYSLFVYNNLTVNGGESYFSNDGLQAMIGQFDSYGIRVDGNILVTGGLLYGSTEQTSSAVDVGIAGYGKVDISGGYVYADSRSGKALIAAYGLNVSNDMNVFVGDYGDFILLEEWNTNEFYSDYTSIRIRPDLFTITFNPNGGTVEPETVQTTENDCLDELPIPVKDGYTFIGWYDDINDGYKVTTNYIFNKDTTLYAYWQCDHLATTKGYCNTCGAIVNGIGALAGYTITLGDNIGVNFYMDLTEATIADTTAYMFFTLPNGDTETVYIKDSIPVTKSDKTYYVFPCGVAVKEMTADIKAQLITNTGNTEEYSYTVEKYATYIIANPVSIDNPNGYSQESIALAKALLNYGASAQSKFDYNTDAYANRSLSDEDRIIHDVSVETLVSYAKDIGQAISGVKYEGTSTVWETNTIIRHYFTLDDTTTITFKLGDRELVPVLGNNGMCYVDIDGIVAKNMVKSYQLDISNGIETQTITYSVYSYFYDILKGVYSEVSKTGVKAAYWYSQAAIAYLNSK